MLRRVIIPVIFGVVGVAILASLGAWQLRRLDWKETVLAEIDRRIAAEPVPVPLSPTEAEDEFLPVMATGVTGKELHVLVSQKQVGAGYRIVTAFDTGDRILMLDRGFVVDAEKNAPRPPRSLEVVGNLHWPDERDSFTPENDVAANIWFARDVPEMADALGAEPILIVAKEPTGDAIQPIGVDSSGVPNNHFGYAVQWFGLALVWAAMTAYWLWRNRQKAGRKAE